jgi:stage V sporulation protein SpoVS
MFRGNVAKVAKPAGVGRPGDEGHFGANSFQPALHPHDELLHPPIGPVLIAAKRWVLEIDVGNLLAGLAAKGRAAVLAVADAAVVQTVEAEGVDRIFFADLGEHLDHKVAIGSEQAQHAAVGMLHEIDLRDLRRVRRNPPPLGMVGVRFPLQARRIDAEDANSQSLVLGDFFVDLGQRDVRTAAFQQLAVVVGVERIDEAEFADRDTQLDGLLASLGRVSREGVSHACRRLEPGGNLYRPKRLRLIGLRQDRPRLKAGGGFLGEGWRC